MGILGRYLVGTVLLYSAMVIGVFLTLGGLFVFIGQQDDIGVGDYGAADALLFSILNLPQQAYEVMPISVLLGSLLGLGALARGSELVVVRASGVSVKRVAAWVAGGGLILMVLALALGEYIAPPLQKFARQQKAFSKFADVSFASSGSAWIKDGNMMISVEEQTGAALFGGIFVFRFSDPQESVRVLTEAGFLQASVTHVPQFWRLTSSDDLFDFFYNASVRNAALLRAQSPSVLDAIRMAVRAGVKGFGKADCFEIPMPAVLSSGLKG